MLQNVGTPAIPNVAQGGKLCPCCRCRLYTADDVEYIEQDLEQVRVLFLADGQGLPAQDIDELCQPVVDLLNVLQLETGILIKNFKDVSPCQRAPSPGLMLGVGGRGSL